MNNKGLSAIIGVILMIAITVAVASVVYVYVTGEIERQESERIYSKSGCILTTEADCCGGIEIRFQDGSKLELEYNNYFNDLRPDYCYLITYQDNRIISLENTGIVGE